MSYYTVKRQNCRPIRILRNIATKHVTFRMDKKVNDSATMAASLPFSEMRSLTYSLTSFVDDQRRRNKKVNDSHCCSVVQLFKLKVSCHCTRDNDKF